MKRSEINQLIKESMVFFDHHRFKLPPFGHWTPQEWKNKGHEADEIRNNMLGWDLTDFGKGDFHSCGLILFTVRNGNPKAEDNQKPYCEKIMIVEEGQVTPLHFHWDKTEDIINRGGGNLVVKLYNADDKEGLADTEVSVSTDGVVRRVPSGGTITLFPGESITLTPRLYHTFWGEKGKGKVLVGEVSAVNDDEKDNRFFEEIGRFPTIEEDEPPIHHLCSEYPAASS
jgi:D-lyxose ketol-isomerase